MNCFEEHWLRVRAGLDAARGKPGVGCFIAGTPVQMAGGTTRPIEKIKAGDKVESRNPATRKTEAKRVVSPIVKHSTSLVTLALADKPGGKPVETITATTNHPVYVRGRGFVPAGELGIGTQIVTRAGPALWVVGARLKSPIGGVTVYNLTVADDHAYFVGSAQGGVWVHNAGSDCPPLQAGDDLAIIMDGSPYTPTQKGIYAGKVNDLVASMKANGFTKPALDQPLILDADGNIVSGHHRFIAAWLSRTPIPEEFIQRLPGTTQRSPRSWGQVTVKD